MKRILMLSLVLIAGSAQAAGMFDPVTKQDMQAVLSYIDTCDPVLEAKDTANDKYAWCDKFATHFLACSKQYPINPLKEYTDQESYDRMEKVIQCTRAFVDL